MSSIYDDVKRRADEESASRSQIFSIVNAMSLAECEALLAALAAQGWAPEKR